MMTIATMDWIAGLIRREENNHIETWRVNSLLADAGFIRQWTDTSSRSVEVTEYIGGDVWTVDY